MKMSRTALFTALMLASAAASAQKGQTVKLAWIDPLSGLMAAVGTNQLKTFQFLAEHFNKSNPAGVKFEIIGIDNKLSPQETTAAVRSALDQGARYIVQGNGSGPALAIIDALEKNNARNPGKEAVYLNYAAVDPELTNAKCSYWQFRFDADTSMKMKALTEFIKDQPDVKKVYLLNQNYSHGVQVTKFAKEDLKEVRPDIQIVGEDLHPLAQVRDFAPYIAKIKASGADSVITGNWGSDLALLLKASNDAGLNVRYFTYYAGVTGAPTAMGSASAGKVYQAAYAHYNQPGPMQPLMLEFKKRFNDDLYTVGAYNVFAALSVAMAQAKSTEPLKVAAAMEGLKFQGFNGEAELRKSDHQIQQALFVTRWEKASTNFPYSPENTGYTLAPVKTIATAKASTPTTCQMKRPTK